MSPVIRFMKISERDERIAHVDETTRDARGDKQYLLLEEGTGWGKALNEIVTVEHEFPYSELKIPGTEKGDIVHVEGHGEPVLRLGTLDEVDVAWAKRVHPYGNFSKPEIVEATYTLMAGLRESLKGAIVGVGAGSLLHEVETGRGPEWDHHVQSKLLESGKIMRAGRPFDPVKKGDIGIVSELMQQYAGGKRHSYTGDFPDLFYRGFHGNDNRHYRHGYSALREEQGPRPPQLVYATMPGPDFESPQLKRLLLSQGVDAVGMSLYASVSALTELDIPFAAFCLITNGVEPHDHAGNQAVGDMSKDKIQALARAVVRGWPDKA